MTRVYLPSTLDRLRVLLDTGAHPATTDGVLAEGDDEASEYAAVMTAADASAELLAGAGRRVVVVAEVADPDAAVPIADVVSVLADPTDRPAGADPDEDLAWFATQEIADLLAR
ncbi:hypothetical protein BH11ACT8_BH11ACT8_09400 [soil metagenome]